MVVVEAVGVEVDDPLVVVVLTHEQSLRGLPLAQSLAASYNRQSLAAAHLRRTHNEAERLAIVA